MATVPTTSTFAAGEKPTAAKLNANGKTALDFLLNPPTCKVYQAANVNLTTAVDTTISWDSEEWDTDNLNVSGVITVQTPGLYLITSTINFASNATGYRQWSVLVNGNIKRVERIAAANGSATHMGSAFHVRLFANDVVSFKAFQNSGATLATAGGAQYSFATLQWVAL